MNVTTIVNKYLGVNYVDNGRDILTGLDCWGLIIDIVKDLFDLTLPDLNYKKVGLMRQYVQIEKSGKQHIFENKNMIIKNYDLSGWVDSVTTQPILGDIMLICPIENLAIHAGIYLQSGKFIHAISEQGVIVSEVIQWNTQIEGYYRLKAELINKVS